MTKPKPRHEPILASTDGDEDFWWLGAPGRREASVIKTDRFGQRWVLDVERTAWVTQRVAAGLLDVSVMTINNWIRDGKIRESKQRRVRGNLVVRDGKISIPELPSVSVIPLKEVERLAEERGIFRETPVAPGRRRPLVPADLKRKKGGDKNADQGGTGSQE